VLGCQSRRLAPALYTRQSSRRDQRPADNGTVCLCYDTLNAECIATCAADIRNYDVRHSTGAGLVTASCPQGTTVLGCGSASPTASQSRHRAAVVAMRTSCRCYDDQQVTCYAVCGLLMAENNYVHVGRLVVPGSNSSAADLRFDSLLEIILHCVLVLIVYKQS